eukprot:1635596-Pyramimonas_sp.AAC.1
MATRRHHPKQYPSPSRASTHIHSTPAASSRPAWQARQTTTKAQGPGAPEGSTAAGGHARSPGPAAPPVQRVRG